MNGKIKNIGELVFYCLHPKFPELKDTTEMEELEKMFVLGMGVIISEEDSLGYLDIYSHKQEKQVTLHREFLKVTTNV